MALGPVERITRPGKTAALPQAGPDAFGAAVGRGMEGLGRSMGRYDLIQRQVERNEKNAAFGKDWAEFMGRFDEFDQDRRLNSGPGAAGYQRDIADYIDTEGEAFLATIDDDRLRQAYGTQLAEFRTRAMHNATLYANGERLKKLTSDDGETQNALLNPVLTAPDLSASADAVMRARESYATTVAGYHGINDDARERMLRAFDQRLTLTAAQRTLRELPVQAQALVDAGVAPAVAVQTAAGSVRRLADGGSLNGLPPEEVDRFYAQVDVEERRAAAAADHQANLAKSAAREQLATITARIEAGEDVPDAELQQAQALAETIGDTSGAYKLGATRIKSAVNRETESWTPSQFSTAINELREKGDARTAQEDIRLKQLETIAPGRTREFNANPGAWAARNGMAPPPLDLTDPASIAARRQWQASVSRETGRPVPFLQPAEEADLKATYEDGPQGRLEVIDALAPLGGISAVKALRQIAPNDAYEQQLVLLDKGQRGAALRGVDARKADRSLIDEKSEGGSATLALESYRTNVAPALALSDQRQAKAVFDVAANLYADWAARNGVHEFNQDQFDTFQQIALGARRDANGVFHGGVGYVDDHPVLLPPALSSAQFETHLARMSWSAKWAGAPVWSNGERMMPADVRGFTPVMRADGRYVFTGPGGTVLRDGDGDVWSVAIDGKGVHP